MRRKFFIGLFMMVLAAAAGAQESEFVYTDHGKRDPFWPLVNVAGAIINYDEQDLMVSEMVLEGIMTGQAQGNVAIINGMIVNPGDMVGLFKIKDITPDMVILQKDSETFTLKIKKED